MDQYLQLPAVSNSWLTTLKKAPAKLRAQLDGLVVERDSEALLLGKAVHTILLEPDTFASRFMLAGPCTAVLGGGPRKGQQCGNPGKYNGPEEGWRCGQHKPTTWAHGVAVLNPDQWAICQGIRDNALAKGSQYFNKRAFAALKVKGAEVELTGRWDDPATGEPAKLRGDSVADLSATCTDIKTCDDASPIVFPKKVYDFGYYRQQSHYGMGFDVLQRPMRHHLLIACEKVPPYLVAVYRVVDEVIKLGREEVRQLIDIYHECVVSGHWPGYPAKVMDIGLPAWGERQLRDAIQMER
jgi:hypothetical protein